MVSQGHGPVHGRVLRQELRANPAAENRHGRHRQSHHRRLLRRKTASGLLYPRERATMLTAIAPADQTIYIGQQELWHYYHDIGDAAPVVGSPTNGAITSRSSSSSQSPRPPANLSFMRIRPTGIAGAWTQYAAQQGWLEYPGDLKDIDGLMLEIASAEGFGGGPRAPSPSVEHPSTRLQRRAQGPATPSIPCRPSTSARVARPSSTCGWPIEVRF